MNGIMSNGTNSNGIESNGIKSNGVKSNGVESNGVGCNDTMINGTMAKGTNANQKESMKNELSGTSPTYTSNGTTSHRPELIVFSASTAKALLSRAQDLGLWLETHQVAPKTLHSLSYTLGVHRSALAYRRAIVASTTEELMAELSVPGPQRKTVSQAPVTFVFSGQGAQWHAMGLELIQSSRVFQLSIWAMEDALRRQGCTWSLVEELSRSPKHSRIGEAEIAQPATTAVQIALVDLLESFSIRPSRVVGHSSGEIAAAYAAGALSLESAILV
jgi:acyl transferase domain-containing protein